MFLLPISKSLLTYSQRHVQCTLDISERMRYQQDVVVVWDILQEPLGCIIIDDGSIHPLAVFRATWESGVADTGHVS